MFVTVNLRLLSCGSGEISARSSSAFDNDGLLGMRRQAQDELVSEEGGTGPDQRPVQSSRGTQPR